MSAEVRRPASQFRLRQELPLMGLSLLMGFLIWLIAATQTTEQLRMSIPMEPVGVPDNVQLSISPNRVNVALTVPSSLRDMLGPDDFVVEIDLSDSARRAGLGQPEEWDVPISLSQNVRAQGDPRLLDEVSLADPYPANCRVTAQLIAEAVDVRPTLTGTLREGLTLAEQAVVSPARLWVTAPRDLLEELQSSAQGLPTAPIDLAQLEAGVHGIQRTPVLPEGVRVVGMRNRETGVVERVLASSLPEVDVSLVVQEQIVERRISGVRANLQEGFPRTDLRIVETRPESFTVTVRGPASALDLLSAEDLVITAPLLADEPRAGERAVSVLPNLGGSVSAELRDIITVVGIEPVEVWVTMEAVTPPPSTER